MFEWVSLSEKTTTYVPFGFTAAWSDVGTTYFRPSLVRMVNGSNGAACNNSRIRGITIQFYWKSFSSQLDFPILRHVLSGFDENNFSAGAPTSDFSFSAFSASQLFL